MSGDLWLFGCGRVFESIAAAPTAFDGGAVMRVLRLASTDVIAGEALPEPPASDLAVRVFAAVDQSALNFARFDLYARLRLAGFRFKTLVHSAASVDSSAQLGENCWVGAGAIIGAQARLGNNAFVGAGALIESGASLGANLWVGAGARVGADASVGIHSVIGADVRVGDGVSIGRYCSIETPGYYLQALADKTCIDPLFELPVRVYSGAAPRTRARG